MGEIFLARQTGMAGFDRLVILKSLLPDLAKEERFVEQFLHEARIAATLNHPNIVNIYEVGRWEGTYYIAMEYIEGENLGTLLQVTIAERLELPYAHTAMIILDAARGLEYAHQATSSTGEPLGIIHRDVSPQNVMIRTDGVVKVVDFGIAKANMIAQRTAPGIIKGKVRYMSPEALRGQPVSPASDQFSLGVVFWEMLALRRLFKPDSELAVLKQMKQRGVSAPSAVRPGVPEELAAIALRMLQLDAKARYDGLGSVVTDLRAFLARTAPRLEQRQVAAVVDEIIGQRVRDRTREAAVQENFLISLDDAGEPTLPRGELSPPVPTDTKPAKPPKTTGSKAWLVLAALAALLSAVVLMTVLGRSTDPSPTVEVDPAPPPPAAAPAPPPPPTKPALARLSVTSEPAGAELFVGGERIGRTPVVLKLEPRKQHRLRLRKAGFREKEVSISLAQGDDQPLQVVLRKKRGARTPKRPPPPAPPVETGPGFLTVNTQPWTQVTVDGKVVGSSPLFKVPLTPGKHELRLVNGARGIDVTRSVVISTGKVRKLDLRLD